jgi:hypothetical protein
MPIAPDETIDNTTDDALLDSADESTAPELDAVADSPEGDTPDDADAGQPTTGAEEDPAVATPASTSSAPAPEPFAVKAHGKAVALDGAVRIAGEGLRIPEGPAMQRAQQLMSRGLEMETVGRQRIRELEVQTEALQRDQSEAEIHGSAIVQWFNEVASDPDTMIDVLTNWAQHKALFDVRVEKAKFEYDKRRHDWQRKAQEPTPQEQQQQTLASARTVGEEMLKELAPQHGLTESDVQKIQARLLRRPEVYLIEHHGSIAFDDTAFAADVAAEAEDRKALRSTMTTVEQAAQTNAKRQAGTIPATMRAPAATVTPTQPRNAKNGQFKSKDEWEAHMRGE